MSIDHFYNPVGWYPELEKFFPIPPSPQAEQPSSSVPKDDRGYSRLEKFIPSLPANLPSSQPSNNNFTTSLSEQVANDHHSPVDYFSSPSSSIPLPSSIPPPSNNTSTYPISEDMEYDYLPQVDRLEQGDDSCASERIDNQKIAEDPMDESKKPTDYCRYCGTEETTRWRSGPNNIQLCNADYTIYIKQRKYYPIEADAQYQVKYKTLAEARQAQAKTKTHTIAHSNFKLNPYCQVCGTTSSSRFVFSNDLKLYICERDRKGFTKQKRWNLEEAKNLYRQKYFCHPADLDRETSYDQNTKY